MRKKKQISIIIISMTIALVFFLSIGYSLFGESLSIGAKGIINEPPAAKLTDIIFQNEDLNDGEGLHAYGNKYYYRGADVHNYVRFNNELWKIISIESDGSIKIIKDDPLSSLTLSQLEENTGFWSNYLSETNVNSLISNEKPIFDPKGRRPIDNNLSNSYCYANRNGCNAYTTGFYNNKVVDGDSVMKLFLETVYYPSLPTQAKQQTVKYNFKIGIVPSLVIAFSNVVDYEETITYESYIGLANISDYVLGTQSFLCQVSFSSSSCGSNNWLRINNRQWYLINPKSTTNNSQVWTANGNNGKITGDDADNGHYIRPVLVLNKNISATGTGTSWDPYVVGRIV